MRRVDAIVVGGGPAGSTCAWALGRAGWHVAVLDRERFPRDKVCAGWLTPPVFPLLDLDPAEYRVAGLTLQEISGFRTGVADTAHATAPRSSVETQYSRTVSYAIRRSEFDHFLLERARAHVMAGTPVKTIERRGDRWVVNGEIEAPVIVGAGGHFCPVARFVGQPDKGAAPDLSPVVAKEAEFRATRLHTDESSPELWFCRDFEGYGWCVRKGDYVNVGIGRRDSRDFARHVSNFIAMLEARGTLVPGTSIKWRGHAYFAAGVGPRALVGEGILIVGDAAGLAYPESGEGILPAIASGRLAADTLIGAGGRYTIEDLQPYARALRERHPPAARPTAIVRRASAALGRMLLGSRLFTRHVLLDRWFLRLPTSVISAER